MPALVQKNARSSNGTGTKQSGSSSAGSGIWSNNREELSLEQLDKFWNELPPHARQKLLRIEKQTFFEHARKNMYCSRCNGLLLEVFSQIVLYGKSLQRESGGGHLCHKPRIVTNELETESVDVWDPSVHPWGGLIATRDSTLTVMDCYLYAKCLSPLQNVFDNARAREHERELLYPDACGGGGRGWMSHGMTNNGRVHGTRETCALHTARLSCDTLLDFWSALGDETQLSLLRMKEEDFIERLMYRFDCKRFCRDCRRNVIREFKELKELKRMRRETHCTHWFCVADTAFQYEVSDDMVQADWRQSFTETVGSYHHFEWAIGTGEGKSDILDFEDVGMAGEVQVDGLDLCDLDACFIMLRAWRLDGHCTELTVKAHALKGQPCVHRRLVVGDGFVTITKGENIRMFFEHAEEAEEEDDDAMDKNGNDLDSDGSRPQKHARSPELARQFLLDAATVIFKEQVEKAFREGTARQNAHNTFVCLALKLLEERVDVACKEIITLEKQIKLLEEEEKEKREEKERRERRRTKEREKKLRRKEKLKEKEQGKKIKDNQCNMFLTAVETPPSVSFIYTHEKAVNNLDFEDSYGEELVGPCSPDISDKNSNSSVSSKIQDLENNGFHHSHYIDEESNCSEEVNGSFIQEQSKSTKRKLRLKQDSIFRKASKQPGKPQSKFDTDSQLHHDVLRCRSRIDRNSRANTQHLLSRNCGLKNGDKFHTSKNRIHDGYKYNSCDCNHHADFGEKSVYHVPFARPGWETRTSMGQSTLNSHRQSYSSKYNHGCHATDGPVILKGKPGTIGSSHLSRTVLHMKKVWEPIDSRKKCIKNSYDNELSSRSFQDNSSQCVGCDTTRKGCQHTHDAQASNGHHLPGDSNDSGETINSSCNDCMCISNISNTAVNIVFSDDLGSGKTLCYYSKDADEYKTDARSVSFAFASSNRSDTLVSSSSSDNCSSCLSEADSSSSSSSAGNAEPSSTSDSEDASQQYVGREMSRCNGNNHHSRQDCGTDDKNKIDAVASISNSTATGIPVASCAGANFMNSKPIQSAPRIFDASRYGYDTVSRHQQMLPMHNNSFHAPYYSALTMTYQSHAQTSFLAIPTNGIISFSQPHQYLFPNPVCYGLAANLPSNFSMQYSGMHPLTTAIPSANQPSTCQSVNKANIMKFDMQTRNSKMNGNPQGNGSGDTTRTNNTVEGSTLSRQPLSKSLDKERAGAGQSYKTSFSLFHSGGPAASGHSLDPSSLKNKTIPEIQTKSATEETTVEEYSLFAASGRRFSFF